jgi:hypothetical protein
MARYPAGYPTRRAEEPAITRRFPVAFRPPAFASWSSDARQGVGPSLRSAYRTRGSGPRRGYHVPHARAATGVGASSIPGTGGALPAERPPPAGTCRVLSGQSLHPAPTSHPHGATDHETSTEVHAIHPSGLPLACDPRMGRAPLGSPPSFEPRRPRAGRRTSGWGQASEHGPGTTRSTSHQSILQSRRSLVTCDLVSHDRPRCAARSG